MPHCMRRIAAKLSFLDSVQWRAQRKELCRQHPMQVDILLLASPCSLSLVSWQGSSATLPSSSLGGVSKEIPSSGAGAKPGAAARALQMPRCLVSLLHLHAQFWK